MTEPYYEDEWVTLFLGDYRLHGDALKGVHADAVITDPPYGETSLEWDVWPTGWLSDATTLTDNLWCFGSFRMFNEHAAEFASWRFAQDLVWEKQNGSSFHVDRFKRVHESATQWYRGVWGDLYNAPPKTPDAIKRQARSKKRPAHMGQIDRTAYESVDGGDRIMRSVVKLRNMHGRAINETEKPVGLVSLLVQASVPPLGLVVDLFAGSGSTGLAARQQGKRALLFELREEQCELTAKRLERETAQPFDLSALV